MISLAYITLNEEKYIARSISSVREIADEIVVLDALSSDKTVEICESLGAKVYSEAWEDDFSKARNKLISYCHQDWILMLDADEHLESENLGLIRDAINSSDRSEIVAWQFPRKNHYPIHEPDSPYYLAPFYPDFQARLFKRTPKIYFSGVVHEGIMQSIEVEECGWVGRLSVNIHHHMFRGDKEKYEDVKQSYYDKLLRGQTNG